MKSSFKLLLALVLVLSSAAYANASLADREVQENNTTANTAITSADLEHRFLAMIKNIDSFDDLSANSMRRVMGVPFTTNGDKNSGFYVLQSPNTHWEYSLTYSFDKKFPKYSNATLETFESENASEATPPPCDFTLKEYDASLKESGFKPEPTSYNEFAWALDRTIPPKERRGSRSLGRLMALVYDNKRAAQYHVIACSAAPR